MAGGVLGDPQSWQQVLALVLAATVVMGSPGPATISVTAVGAAFGLSPSLSYTAGVVLGTIAVLLAVAAGIFGMLTSVPGVAPVLAILSAAYILYLAFKIATAPPLAERGSTATKPDFLGGFALAAANPKAYVAIGAVYAGAASQPDPLGIFTRLLVLAAMIVAIHVVWLLAGTAFARFLRHPLASRVINLVFAATLVLTTLLAVLR
ncbi:LysE family translocator [Mesorhizobium sp. M2A.F.Ca.ET.037.01.1.1]|uniref:LysE family translocator n=1 Tax=unclassified Mesorhizobium TaxID=325217 RepID=UPI000F74FE13|nr:MULTISPECIES: LysE family translocator [unclassified Mesorhizobium]RUY07120.1 LysE family translocator [Mesorhizobium sp. M2A.F.Ca.ET.040.01.1.1]RVC63586.1 LysE family translocator [Mesorhizobium sp. M00.F.Ca.ET.038.03.1.1]AZO36514.1 LysE family translocator [Mesorhizobium sp. M2A.F.Ca.ET.046.03.2.1]RUX09146.1 LysE family translocator [Mesorhizobium sp. M2A.F.Ca.ET.037.01.1.1]RWA89507.1 MAG: LysE family translocator [Mesorhizobium sp.]